MIITNSINSIPLQRVLKEIHGDNEDGRTMVCAELCVVEDEIKFRESTKRERERERGANRISRGEVLACTPRRRGWSTGPGNLPVPRAGRRQGAAAAAARYTRRRRRRPRRRDAHRFEGPRPFHGRSSDVTGVSAPPPPPDKIRPPRSGISCYCAASIPIEMLLTLWMNSERLMEGGFLGGRDDSIIVLYSLYIYVSFVLILQHRLLILVKFIGIRESIRFHVGCKLCVAKSEGMRV